MISGYLGSTYLAGAQTETVSEPTVQYINLWPIKAVAFAYVNRKAGTTLNEVLNLN